MTVVNPATGELVYTNAGHNPPLLIRADGTVEDLKGQRDHPRHPTHRQVRRFSRDDGNPGDMLVLYSDGVTEAATAADDDFGETRS